MEYVIWSIMAIHGVVALIILWKGLVGEGDIWFIVISDIALGVTMFASSLLGLDNHVTQKWEGYLFYFSGVLILAIVCLARLGKKS